MRATSFSSQFDLLVFRAFLFSFHSICKYSIDAYNFDGQIHCFVFMANQTEQKTA